jgi:hypothetical protein
MSEGEGRATSSLARVIIENFFYAGLPPQMRTALEEDEKRLGVNRRDYINHLLFERVRMIERQKPARRRGDRDGRCAQRRCLSQRDRGATAATNAIRVRTRAERGTSVASGSE